MNCLKCVGYDVSWQQSLIERHSKWLQRQAERESQRPKKTTGKRKRRTSGKSAGGAIGRLTPSHDNAVHEDEDHEVARAGLSGCLSDLTDLASSESDVEMVETS